MSADSPVRSTVALYDIHAPDTEIKREESGDEAMSDGDPEEISSMAIQWDWATKV